MQQHAQAERADCSALGHGAQSVSRASGGESEGVGWKVWGAHRGDAWGFHCRYGVFAKGVVRRESKRKNHAQVLRGLVGRLLTA